MEHTSSKDESLYRATILLTGFPDLAPTPMSARLRTRLSSILNGLRFGVECLLEPFVVVPWLALQMEHGFAFLSQQGRALMNYFPEEFWVGGLMILLTIALIVL